MDDATRTKIANKYEELAESIYQRTTAEGLVGHIERQFQNAYEKKMSRMDPRWSIWSGAMNRITKERRRNKDPDSEKLEMVYQYWQAVSQLLELYFKRKSKLFGSSKIKQKKRHIKQMKEVILND